MNTIEKLKEISLEKSITFFNRPSLTFPNASTDVSEVLNVANQFFEFLSGQMTFESQAKKVKTNSDLIINSEPVAVNDAKPTINKN